MYKFKIEDELAKILTKLKKKDNPQYNKIRNKIKEVVNSNNIDHYKNLRNDLKDYKRAHIGSFVILFRFDRLEDKIYFVYYNHHDNVYKWKTKN